MEKCRFETLLGECKGAVERFVYYKTPCKADGDDVLQEVYLTAFQKRETLRDEAAFKAWVLKIARNKCNDFYRSRAGRAELPLAEAAAAAQWDVQESSAVQDTLALLPLRDAQILGLFYLDGKPQAEIAALLGIPPGTVKSRLHTARARFKAQYPSPPAWKGAKLMKTLPEQMPEYQIRANEKEPFALRWEELSGLFIVPRIGETLQWGSYDAKTRRRGEWSAMQVLGQATVHGIAGVEIREQRHEAAGICDHAYIAQLTPTHCRLLAEHYERNGVRHYVTFLDSDEFLAEWDCGTGDCGREIALPAQGKIRRNGREITAENSAQLTDIVGSCTVTLGGKTRDTVCLMTLDARGENAVATEQYLDKNGRTVLWRRFNRAQEECQSEEVLIINGERYLHCYDCLTDYGC